MQSIFALIKLKQAIPANLILNPKGAYMLQKTGIAWGLFLLRLGLGLSWVLWSIDKIARPEASIESFSQFYHIEIGSAIIVILGGIQLVLSLLMTLGMYKTLTYGFGLLLQTLSCILIFSQIPSIFGEYHLYILKIPIVFSFLTLFLLRHMDSKLSLGKKKTIFT